MVKLSTARFKSAEYERNIWVATAEQGMKLEDLNDPGFWAHVVNKMRAWDHIEARADDGTWIAEFLVLSVGRQWAKVTMLWSKVLTTEDVSLSEAATLETRWRGPHAKWGVIRTSDKAVLKEEFQTKDEALVWAREHEKTTG